MTYFPKHLVFKIQHNNCLRMWIYFYVVFFVIKLAQSVDPTPQLSTFPTRPVTTKFAQFTRPSFTTKHRSKRTTPFRISFAENCDYLAHYCLKAYETGKVCGRTLYYTYHTFKNYCLLDYVNCMERYEVWQVVHMGECFTISELDEYLKYPYDDDYFLDQYYVLEDH